MKKRRNPFFPIPRIALRILLFTIGFSAIAVITQPFSGWDNLKRKSSDIVVVRCVKTPERLQVGADGVVIEPKDALVSSDIQIVLVVQGRTKVEPAKLLSQFMPHQDEQYLVFANYQDGSFQAIEPFRIIPLGTEFSTNLLSGRSATQQIRVMLQYRYDRLSPQTREQKEEKNRLKEGF